MLVIVLTSQHGKTYLLFGLNHPHLQITCNHLVCDRRNENFTKRELWRKQAEATGQTNSEAIEFDKIGLFVSTSLIGK
jgi:galactose-1-phosphate uridylyltransferase